MWFKPFFIALLAISAIGSILTVGDERKPSTPDTAALTVIVNALLILGIVYYL